MVWNLKEFCICGIKINILFFENVVKYDKFLIGVYDILFIDIMFEFFVFLKWKDCGIKMFIYIGNVMVNGFLGVLEKKKLIFIKLCVFSVDISKLI